MPEKIVKIPLAPAIFGTCDGLVCAAGIVAGLVVIHASAGTVWGAAFSVGLAEFAGMAAGQYQSCPQDGWFPAFICGLATLLGAILPVIPYLFLSGTWALIAALIVAMILCGLIAHVRPERGIKAYLLSYGVMAVAIALCIAGGFIH